jgi:hypothetical protein
MNQTITDRQLEQFFKENDIKGSVHYYDANGRRLRYIAMGQDHLPTLFFIHGSPANGIMYQEYYKHPLLKKVSNKILELYAYITNTSIQHSVPQPPGLKN